MTDTKFPELAFAKFIKKAEALNVPKSILIYGDPKNGKTWLAASASELEQFSPVLLVDVEGGASAIARDWKNVDVIQVDTHAQLDSVLEGLLTTDHKYKTVIIDTLGVAMDRAEKVFEEKSLLLTHKTRRMSRLVRSKPFQCSPAQPETPFLQFQTLLAT